MIIMTDPITRRHHPDERQAAEAFNAGERITVGALTVRTLGDDRVRCEIGGRVSDITWDELVAALDGPPARCVGDAA